MSIVVVMLIPLVVIAGIVTIIFVILRWGSNRTEQLQQVGATLDAVLRTEAGRDGSGMFFGSAMARIRGREVRVEQRTGSRNSPPTLTVELPIEVRYEPARAPQAAYRSSGAVAVKGTLAVRFRTETWQDRFGRAIGLNREHPTGDPDFDRAVYIESDASSDDLALLLGDQAVRRAILAVLLTGATAIDLFRDRDVLSVLYARPTPEAAARLAGTVELLGQVADALPTFERDPVEKGLSRRMVGAIAVGAGGLALSLIAAGIANGTYRTIEPGAISTCILAGLGVWVVASAVSFALVRRGRDSLRAFAILFFSLAVAMPAATVAVAVFANGAADGAPATEHTVKVTRTWITTSKNSKTYHVAFQSWRPDLREIESTVSASFYSDLIVGDDLVVVSKPGRLGWEWIDELRRHRPRSSAP